MSVNMIAASRRVSDCTVLLGSFFIGADYSAGVTKLQTVHGLRANVIDHLPPPNRLFHSRQIRQRAAVRCTGELDIEALADHLSRGKPRTKNRHNRFNDLLEYLLFQSAHLVYHQIPIGGEELPRTSIASDP
jgi:hypothetical protein